MGEIGVFNSSTNSWRQIGINRERLACVESYKRNIMQALLSHLVREYITTEQSELLKELLKLQPVTLTSTLRLTPQDLQLVQYLLSKNFIAYSPAHLTLTLAPRAVLLYQRIHKLKHFAEQYTLSAFQQLLAAYIGNELLPVPVPAAVLKGLQEGQGQGEEMREKGKGRKGQEVERVEREKGESVDYSRLVYEYSEKGAQKEQVECVVNLDELTDLLKFHRLHQLLAPKREQILKSIQYALGEQPLHSLSFLQMQRTVRENRPKADFIRNLLQSAREQKVQEYLLQLFRRLDLEGEGPPQQSARNVLLVFNLVRKWPLISDKELQAKSLLSVAELKRALNMLVMEGLMNYYPENFRTTLYKITNYGEIERRVQDHLATALLNLHIAATRTLPKEQLLKLECMAAELDDVLLLFT